jgi:hypothetical protein
MEGGTANTAGSIHLTARAFAASWPMTLQIGPSAAQVKSWSQANAAAHLKN